ncbi:MAG: hypothetical protein ACFB15_29275 [Cyclobacteriaceae bacterium]
MARVDIYTLGVAIPSLSDRWHLLGKVKHLLVSLGKHKNGG